MPESTIGTGLSRRSPRDEDAVGEAAVRELQTGHQVSDGEHAVDVGAQPLVGRHEAAVEGDADVLVAEARTVRPAADGHEQQLGVERLAALERDVHRLVVLRRTREADAGLERDLALAVGPLERLAGCLVLGGDEAGQRLDDRDVGTEGLPDAGELDADDAAAEHDDALGDEVEGQCLVTGDDAPADVEPGQRPRVRAARQHDVAALQLLVAHLHGVGGDEPPLTLDHMHLVRRDEPLEALVQPADDGVLVLVDPSHVDALERGLDAEVLTFAGSVGDLGRVQQRLGGDAAAVQAGAAQLVLLD
jgi:hypothetical protein